MPNFSTSSFKDPFGSVFSLGLEIYRSIFQAGLEDFKAAKAAGVHNDLISEGLLLPYTEIPPTDFAPEDTRILLTHPRLPFISYPWEWCFSMLKDAAILHLEIMQRILPKGFWLRDASAFNVQFDGNRLLFIDVLSIGRRIEQSPWVAYGQFCSHFLAPLAMAAYSDIRLLNLWRAFIDGFPLDLAVKMLPRTTLLRPGIFMHLVLHSRYQEKNADKASLRTNLKQSAPKITLGGLLALVNSLKSTLGSLKWRRASRIWETYGDIRTYDDQDKSKKAEFISNVVNNIKPNIIWDLGANTGEYSILAARNGGFVVSIDGDPACTENLYEKVRVGNSDGPVLPLTMDLANPSPPTGWNSQERMSLTERGPADLILALALIHHLVFTSCIPLELVAKWLATSGRHLLIEFIPPTDPMVEKLTANRRGEHLPYSEPLFTAVFNKYFKLSAMTGLNNGRVLVLYERY